MEQSQIDQYIPVGLLGIVAMLFAGGVLAASVIFGKLGKRGGIKEVAYECGMLPIGEGSPRMSVKFYLVAMLFILFDIEVIFMYPWAIIFKESLKLNADLIFGSMITFLGILFVGYVYALKKDAFNWKQ